MSDSVSDCESFPCARAPLLCLPHLSPCPSFYLSKSLSVCMCCHLSWVSTCLQGYPSIYRSVLSVFYLVVSSSIQPCIPIFPHMNYSLCGWMVGWMDGWMDGSMCIGISVCICIVYASHMCVCMHGWVHRQMHGWMHGWMHGRIVCWLHICASCLRASMHAPAFVHLLLEIPAFQFSASFRA